MENRKKNAIYSLILVVVIVAVWTYRNKTDNSEQNEMLYTNVTGSAQGTTYSITYKDSKKRFFKNSIDSLLAVFDKNLSTYRPDSEISKFNQPGVDSVYFNLPYFYPVLEVAEKINRDSKGAFDPTIFPLINAWGFGEEQTDFPDTTIINQLKQTIGFDKIDFNTQAVWKKTENIGLNFNAIAQGYAIDVVFSFLRANGIENMMIELGGEVRTLGVSDRNEPWSIGIDNPKPENNNGKRAAIVKLNNEAISTSGNYRNYLEHNGIVYGHTIDPRTGFPVQRDIISATVLASTCMLADGWSTAFMVLGLNDSKKILAQHPELKAYFIYEDEQGALHNFVTDNLKNNIILGE